MGTNYYVHTPACANACDHCAASEELHLREARRRSLGEDCRRKLGLRTAPRQDGHNVEQDVPFEE